MTGVERLPARVLLVGALLGIALMVLGTGVSALQDGGRPGLVEIRAGALATGASHAAFRSAGETWRALFHRWPPDPAAVATAGILLLLATPVVAVAASVPAFLRVGDARFAVIALVVLAALLVSFTLGAG